MATSIRHRDRRAPAPHGVVARLPADRYVIAADSGLDHALALGLPVDALIGDLDSCPRRPANADTPARRSTTSRRTKTPPTPSWRSNWRSRWAAIRSSASPARAAPRPRARALLPHVSSMRRSAWRHGATTRRSARPARSRNRGAGDDRVAAPRSRRGRRCLDDRSRLPPRSRSPGGTSRSIGLGTGTPAAVSIGLEHAARHLADARQSRRNRRNAEDPDAPPAAVVPAAPPAPCAHGARRRLRLLGRLRRRLAGGATRRPRSCSHHDSFVVGRQAAAFEEESGIEVEDPASRRRGELVNRAILTAGNPQGDLLWGGQHPDVAGIEGDLFEPYESPALDALDPARGARPRARVTPIDHGDVCLNNDIEAGSPSRDIAPPATLDDLADPGYEGLRSSRTRPRPLRSGLPAGDDRPLRDRRLRVLVDAARQRRARRRRLGAAYYARFSGWWGRRRPIVVSYASSPPAKVIFAERLGRRRRRRPSLEDVLPPDRVRRYPARRPQRGGARGSSSTSWSPGAVPGDVPLTNFVVPADPDVELPPSFEQFASGSQPAHRPPEEIDANRDEWVDEWTPDRPPLANGRRALTRPACAPLLAFPAAVPRLSAWPVLTIEVAERGVDAAGDRRLLGDDPRRSRSSGSRSGRRRVSTGLTVAIALSGRLRPRPLHASRERARAGLRRRAVRPPTVVVALAFLAVLPDGLERGCRDPRRARVLQRRRRRAGRRCLLGRTRPAGERRRGDARAGPWQTAARGDAALLAPSLAAAAAATRVPSSASRRSGSSLSSVGPDTRRSRPRSTTRRPAPRPAGRGCAVASSSSPVSRGRLVTCARGELYVARSPCGATATSSAPRRRGQRARRRQPDGLPLCTSVLLPRSPCSSNVRSSRLRAGARGLSRAGTIPSTRCWRPPGSAVGCRRRR